MSSVIFTSEVVSQRKGGGVSLAIYGGLNYGQLRSQVHLTVLDVYPDRIDDALVKKWVKQGHLEIDTRLRWTRGTDTFDTVNGTVSYTPTTTNRNIVAVVYDSTEVLEEIDFQHYLRKYSDSQATSDPDHYAMWGGTMYLYPTPDDAKTVTLYVIELPTELSADGDIPTIPPELHWLIVDFALSKAYFHLQDINSATNYYAKFERDLAAWEDNVESYRNRQVAVADIWPGHA